MVHIPSPSSQLITVLLLTQMELGIKIWPPSSIRQLWLYRMEELIMSELGQLSIWTSVFMCLCACISVTHCPVDWGHFWHRKCKLCLFNYGSASYDHWGKKKRKRGFSHPLTLATNSQSLLHRMPCSAPSTYAVSCHDLLMKFFLFSLFK